MRLHNALIFQRKPTWRNRRGGFTLLVTLLLFVLFAAGVVMLTQALGQQNLRTVQTARRAQAHALLAAGIIYIHAHLPIHAQSVGRTWHVPLPRALRWRGDRLTVAFNPQNHDDIAATISLTLPNPGGATIKKREKITLHRTIVGWGVKQVSHPGGMW